jgi:hypothetical protein
MNSELELQRKLPRQPFETHIRCPPSKQPYVTPASHLLKGTPHAVRKRVGKVHSSISSAIGSGGDY